MPDDLSAYVFSIGRRDRLVNLFLRHPVNPHRITSGGNRTVATPCYLYEIIPFAGLPVVIFALVPRMNKWVLCVGYVVWLR